MTKVTGTRIRRTGVEAKKAVIYVRSLDIWQSNAFSIRSLDDTRNPKLYSETKARLERWLKEGLRQTEP